MRVLHIGGTGLISSACVNNDLALGREVFILNRSLTSKVEAPEGIIRFHADAGDSATVKAAIGPIRFDSVIQWVAYTPDQVRKDIDLYRDHGQYVFVSSASAYQTPPNHWLVAEATTPLSNPHWQYSRDKIACEETLRRAHSETKFPMTIVRPTLTYGLSQIPVCVGSWEHPFTIVDRIRRGVPIIVPGDGTALWTITHNTDFAKGLSGLLGLGAAIGEDFHITSDEALTWNQIYRLLGEAAGASPNILHVPADALVAADPTLEGTLWGDKIHSTVFDNSKIKAFVPGFEATVPFLQGIRETVAWFDADPLRQTIDAAANQLWDGVAAIYVEALLKAASLPSP